MRPFSLLPPPALHAPIERFDFDEIHGTNAFAARWMRLGSSGAESAILSRAQTSGRGQHGREWSTERGLDLAWSYARRFGDAVALDGNELVALNKAWAVAVLEVVEQRVQAEVGLKWPNDLYAQAQGSEWRKLGGLLIEAHWRGSGCIGVVVGVGVNAGSTRRDFASPAVSLRELGAEAVDLASMGRDLEHAVRAVWDRPFNEPSYENRLLFRGEMRDFLVDSNVRRGAFLGTLPDGRGRFRWDEGEQVHPQGDVVWLWNQG